MTVKRRRVPDGARVRYRIGQGVTYLRPRRATVIDQRLRMLLRPAEYALLSRLSLPDRAHHLDVYERLLRHGCADSDLLKAALLHDAGKADGIAQVGLLPRALAVIVSAIVPGLPTRLGRADGPRWRRSLLLLDTHPARGATLARNAGCNDRVCWMIKHHHDRDISDEGLEMLRRADDGRLR